MKKAYCSFKFIFGVILVWVSAMIHLSVLPYLDITLTSANSTLGIIIAMVLSLIILKERFIVKYDLPGLLFIIAGCTTIVINANKID